ncbi:MAG: hypothetical protein ACPF83_09535 [Flavobacteriales bacterium]
MTRRGNEHEVNLEGGSIPNNGECEITGDEEVTTPDMLYLLGVFNTDCE